MSKTQPPVSPFAKGGCKHSRPTGCGSARAEREQSPLEGGGPASGGAGGCDASSSSSRGVVAALTPPGPGNTGTTPLQGGL